jgi:hypothetical protein
MEQRSIVLYLAKKGLLALAIHDDLVTTLGAVADAVSYSSVTRYLRAAVFAYSNPPTPLPEPEDQFDDCDHAIMRSCYHAIMLSCDHAIMRSCYHAIMLSCYPLRSS